MENNDEKESFYRDTIEDMGSEKYHLEDPMTFWNAEKKSLWKKILGRSETPFIIMGIGLLVIVVIFFSVYPKNSGQNASPETAGTTDRLQQLEDKMSGMQTQLEGLSQVEQDMELQKKSVARLDSTDASISLRVDRVAEELEALQKEVETIKSKTSTETKSTAASSQAQKPKTGSQAGDYEVRKGDTLYSIGRQYGVSVETIRKLNGLSAQDTIQPGQKLKVKE